MFINDKGSPTMGLFTPEEKQVLYGGADGGLMGRMAKTVLEARGWWYEQNQTPTIGRDGAPRVLTSREVAIERERHSLDSVYQVPVEVERCFKFRLGQAVKHGDRKGEVIGLRWNPRPAPGTFDPSGLTYEADHTWYKTKERQVVKTQEAHGAKNWEYLGVEPGGAIVKRPYAHEVYEYAVFFEDTGERRVLGESELSK